MKINSSDSLVFDNGYYMRNGKVYVQDILFNNNVIGCLVHTQSSILNPVEMYIQVYAHVNHETIFDRFYPTEDVGRIYGIFEFDNIDKYISYVNQFTLN